MTETSSVASSSWSNILSSVIHPRRGSPIDDQHPMTNGGKLSAWIIEREEIGSQRLWLCEYRPYGPLASLDPDCLLVHAWLRLAGIPFQPDYLHEPLASPDEKLPFLLYQKGKTVGHREIRRHLEETFPERNLSDNTLKAVVDLALGILQPEVQKYLWSLNIAIPYYYGHHPWPLNHLLPVLDSRKPSTAGPPMENTVIVTVKKLSDELNQRPWFGEQPGLADAAVYSVLAILLIILPVSHPVRGAIEERPNLMDFVERVQGMIC